MAFPWGMTLPPPKLKTPGEAILLFDAGGAKLNPPCAGAPDPGAMFAAKAGLPEALGANANVFTPVFA